MSPAARCPRCQTVVQFEQGGKPTCPACGYPGADTRGAAAVPSWDTPTSSYGAASSYATAPTPPPYGAQPPNSGKAVAALILGIASFFVGGIVAAIIAIVLGNMARKEIRDSNGALGGMNMANWGLWLGVVNIIATILIVVFFIALIASGVWTYDEANAIVTLVL